MNHDELFRYLSALEDRLFNLNEIKKAFDEHNTEQQNKFMPISRDLELQITQSVKYLHLALDEIPVTVFYGFFATDGNHCFTPAYEVFLSDAPEALEAALTEGNAYAITDDYRNVYEVYESLSEARDNLARHGSDCYLVDSKWNRLPDLPTDTP